MSDNKIIFEEEITVDQDNLAINDSPSSMVKITQGKNDQELVFKVSAEDSGENDLQVPLMPLVKETVTEIAISIPLWWHP